MKYIPPFFLVFLLFVGGCSSQNSSKDKFNIILITIDTLRSDHLSCYGYERETSPAIDKIAEKGILFKNVIAPSSWTAPSMVSLLTSTYPINHGVIHGLLSRQKREQNKRYSQEVFSDELATLPEILRKQGYTTFGIFSNHNLQAKFGFARGFDYYKFKRYDELTTAAKQLNELVYQWEDKIKESEKYFLWIHYMDPHIPYKARSPWIDKYSSRSATPNLDYSIMSANEINDLIPTFKENPHALTHLLALYDSEINYVDSYVGDLIKRFKLDKNTLLIITSDHGEQFLEHGRIGHSLNLHQEETHPPLIIKLPYVSEMVKIEDQVSLIDILPTILHLLDTDPPEQTIGKVLLKDKAPLNRQKTMLSSISDARYIFSELDNNYMLKAIITPAWKYIYNYKDKTDQLYNIKSDPNELNNLADKKTEQCNQLKKELLNWVSTSKTYPVKSQFFQLSQVEKERLEAIGYVATREDKDYDKDGVTDINDNCHDDYNPDQSDYDKDGIGDVCDDCTDIDRDGYGNSGLSNACVEDNCPYIVNPGQEDVDGDGIGDACESKYEDHWLEAEYAQAIARQLQVADEEDASKGKYVYAPNGTGDQYKPGTTMAIYLLNISQAGEYVLWGKVSAANEGDNSFFVQVDNGVDNLWEVEPGNYWHWDTVNNRHESDPVKFILTEGLHKIKVKLREDGTKLDKLLLTNNLGFVPRGKGGHAEN